MIIIDIESKPKSHLVDSFNASITAPKNYKDEDKIKEYLENAKKDSRKKMSTDVDYAEPWIIGVKELNGEAFTFSPQEFFNRFTEEKQKEVIITFNGKSFDIPILMRYAALNGYPQAAKSLKTRLRKWNEDGHIDLMEFLGQGDMRSLDEYAKIYLGEEKKPIDFETCTEEELREHCADDCRLTERLFNKFNSLFI